MKTHLEILSCTVLLTAPIIFVVLLTNVIAFAVVSLTLITCIAAVALYERYTSNSGFAKSLSDILSNKPSVK